MTTPYVTVGSGDHHVLAVHGWFGSAHGWGALPEYVDQDDFTYVFMNLRGYAERRDVEGQYTTEEAGADALQLADDLGWDRFSLIGHSMGGKLIQHVLVEAPQRVRALIAVAPVPASGVPFDDDAWALFSGAAGNPANRAAIINITTGNRLTPRFIDSIVQHSIDHSEAKAFGAYLHSWGKADFSAQVIGNPRRITVIVGEHDLALGESFARQTWMLHYPNAELIVFPNAGHYPMFETPVALVTAIEQHLRQE